jgi:large subunit ribosomal protein L15
VVTPDSMLQAGLLKKGSQGVKVLGNGELKIGLTVRAHKFTETAARKIESAGGTVELLGK